METVFTTENKIIVFIDSYIFNGYTNADEKITYEELKLFIKEFFIEPNKEMKVFIDDQEKTYFIISD